MAFLVLVVAVRELQCGWHFHWVLEVSSSARNVQLVVMPCPVMLDDMSRVLDDVLVRLGSGGDCRNRQGQKAC